MPDRLMLQLSAFSVSETHTPAFPDAAWEEDLSMDRCCPNALSNELLEHMLDCEACLSESLQEEMVGCSLYRHLQEQIASRGGPTKPIVFSY